MAPPPFQETRALSDSSLLYWESPLSPSHLPTSHPFSVKVHPYPLQRRDFLLWPTDSTHTSNTALSFGLMEGTLSVCVS